MVLIAAFVVNYVYAQACIAKFSEIRVSLAAVAASAARTLSGQPGEEHKQLKSSDQMGTPLHAKLLAPLVQIHKVTPEIYYIYTAIQLAPNDYRIILDTTTNAAELNLTRKVEPSPIMEKYESARPEMKAALEKGDISTTPEFYTDRFGTFISAYAPFTGADTRIAGVVGVDMDRDTVLAQMDGPARQAIIQICVLGIVALAVGYGVYLSRKKALAGVA